MESIIENNSAHQKPSTLNPGTSWEVIKIKIALMTKENNPNVRILIGSVSKTNKGFIKAFNMPSINAVIRDTAKLSTLTPGRI